jgi:hypothetical protein
MQKILKIVLYSIPILIMIGLIPLVQNDYLLTLFYVILIFLSSIIIKFSKNDILFLLFGFVIMIVSEYIFISTGVETFVRNSLFGIMPLWLPFIWAYGFVAIKKSSEVFNDKNTFVI